VDMYPKMGKWVHISSDMHPKTAIRVHIAFLPIIFLPYQ